MNAPSIKDRIQKIEERNRKVELDKAWETSIERKALIGLLTYVVISVFFIYSKVEKPFLNAVVPTIGFVLSTLTLSIFKNYWLKHKQV